MATSRILGPGAVRRWAVLSCLLVVATVATLAVSCGGDGGERRGAAGRVVVYTSLDQQFSEPILRLFERRTGIRVDAVYDTEAVKTVGLVNRLMAERQRPVCDVFWNNEIVHTIQLKREGITQPYFSPSAETLPDSLRDPEGHWNGFAARARVIMVNTQVLPNEETHPTSVLEIENPQWRDAFGFAKPLFGTTNSHAAILFSKWGPERGREYWQAKLDNGVMYAGNVQARDGVVAGEVPWCLTDTDDAYGAIADGRPVRIIYPDSGPDEMGTVVLPNTLALVNGAPNEENGQKLIDFLLSEEVEALLAASRSAQVPVRDNVPGPEGIPSLEGVHVMEVDWEAVVDDLAACQVMLDELVGRR